MTLPTASDQQNKSLKNRYKRSIIDKKSTKNQFLRAKNGENDPFSQLKYEIQILWRTSNKQASCEEIKAEQDLQRTQNREFEYPAHYQKAD